MKKLFITVAACCTMIAVPGICCHALPNAFWEPNTRYEAALAANDSRGIIRYGNEIIAIMQNEAESEQKSNILVSRYDAVGKAYAAVGEYDNSAGCFRELNSYARRYGDKYYDYIITSNAYITQYSSDVRIYTEGGTAPYYGAKNEPGNGVLFGACSNGSIRSELENESMVLIYQELGHNVLPYNKTKLAEASASGCAVEFALNCPEQGQDIANISSMDGYLAEISSLFAGYPDMPIYLRFGAEFDIWDRSVSDGESFKAAFRYVSGYFRSRNQNVAMVWSPNHVSRWDIDIDDYYPGDEYVDWVGMSSYAQRYFLGDPWSDPQNETVFKTGVNSEPVVAVMDIIKKYGDRKPIMISESGAGHYIMTRGEDCSGYALQRLREYYSYLPMVYPQIKLMAYFDHYVDGEINDYRLSTNKALHDEYLRLTKTGRYIQDRYGNDAELCYRELGSGGYIGNVFSVSCYAHRYQDTAKSVAYYIDDNYAGMSDELPFTAYINAGALYGNRRLKCVVTFESGYTMTREEQVNIGGMSDSIKVRISGRPVSFDQPPVIYNDRTMVPMRKIFEELGAAVSWDGETKTASGTLGSTRVDITVGSKLMYINNKAVEIDTPAFVLSDRTLVPVRAIAEGLGCDVSWDGMTYTVDIVQK